MLTLYENGIRFSERRRVKIKLSLFTKTTTKNGKTYPYFTMVIKYLLNVKQ